MKVHLQPLERLEDALALAPRLDACAAEFDRQFTDEPFPAGASERFLSERFAEPETVLVVARADSDAGQLLGLVLVGALVEPLRGTRLPTVLVLHVVPDARHRGLAGELVAEATRLLESRGLTQLAARAGHNDDALISMGERWGFVRQWELMLRD
jgi:GNAT superfamily N-acetyltransferase